MKIAFANDHAATSIRMDLLDAIKSAGHDVIDCGTDSESSVDYPDMAGAAIAEFLAGRADRVVLVCGSGVGMSIAANRHPEVRCVLAVDPWTARMARAHNDANCLALRAREQSPEVNRAILAEFLSGTFEGGRHERRVAKLSSCQLSSPTHSSQPEVSCS
jgi:ribose 5-phosphate isomerase B